MAIKTSETNGSHLGTEKTFVPGGGETFEEAKARYDKTIRQEDLDHWHKHGYVIVKDFLNPQELENLQGAWKTHMPDWEEYKAKEALYAGLIGTTDRNKSTAIARYDFPYDNDYLNQLAVHPFLVAFAERLAETKELALSFGHLIGKYAGRGDYEQEFHSDYGNNTHVWPQKSKKWLDISMIAYLTDVTIDLGPTYVVSQTITEPQRLMENGWKTDQKNTHPDLYENQVPVVVPAGSVVIYSMRTFHRGSAMKAKEGCRVVQFVGMHTKNAPWMAPLDYQHTQGSKEMARFLTNADPGQREMVGFPGAGHEYWKEPDAIQAVARRYPQMDMRPYGGGPPQPKEK